MSKPPVASGAPPLHEGPVPGEVDAEAGCREPFDDPDLYDYEYRHRRADLTFYRHLAMNRMEFAKGPILDLACGSGRLLVPLLRDGHTVVGVDRSPAMLKSATARVSRLSTVRRERCTLVQSDMAEYQLSIEASLAIAAFHSVQHLLTDDRFLAFLRCTRACLAKGAWLSFDVLPPDPRWLGRDSRRRWARTTFRHPTSRQRYVYTTNHVYDPRRKLLHIRLYYQPVDEKGNMSGQERVTRLCHRQYWPEDVRRMLKAAGFRPLALFSGWDGHVLTDGDRDADEHVYVAVAV